MKKVYKYYSIADSKNEPLGKTRAHTIEMAISNFANRKKLSIEEFTNIYRVEEEKN